MGRPWALKRLPWVGRPWVAHGLPRGSHGAHREGHGIPMGLPWVTDTRRRPMDDETAGDN